MRCRWCAWPRVRVLPRRRTSTSEPIKILVPYAPGGATDIVARIVGDQMQQNHRPVGHHQNKPGAFGIIGDRGNGEGGPDGYTLMIGNVSTNAITPIIYPARN